MRARATAGGFAMVWGGLVACGSVPTKPDAALISDAGFAPWFPPRSITWPGWTDLVAHPSVTEDGLELYFARSEGVGSNVFVSKRTDPQDDWGTPVVASNVNSEDYDSHPSVSADGLTLWLSSNRKGGAGLADIWVTTRASRNLPWSEPRALEELNTSSADAPGRVTSDELTMVFHSNRAGGTGGMDLYLASRTSAGGAWSSIRQLAELNTTANDELGWISNDQLTIFYASNSGADYDIMTAYREPTATTFDGAAPVPGINAAGREGGQWLTTDLRYMIFMSDRLAGPGLFETRR